MNELRQNILDELIDCARAARERAYAPYSRYSVGAALLTSTGKIFRGCNIENVSLGLTICAEQGAMAAAVAEDQRVFEAVAVCAESNTGVLPCGRCRQTLAEFGHELTVISCTPDGSFTVHKLSELLPGANLGIEDLKDVGTPR